MKIEIEEELQIIRDALNLYIIAIREENGKLGTVQDTILHLKDRATTMLEDIEDELKKE